MSEAVVVGDRVYLAGMVPERGATVAEQTADVLRQIDETLARAGSDKTKIGRASCRERVCLYV